ncbi:hypothetical protein [Streptomyces achromogenes]|uniref:hypothetical protein n=1 Tax=Streptomyces achromogenes TaxID=67255 RepID=UPI00341B044E
MISAADKPVNWRETVDGIVRGAPTWVLAVVGGAVFITVLIVGALAMHRASKREQERDEDHRAAVAHAQEKGEPVPPKPLHMDTKPLIGGFAVSLNGLWHFAQDQVHLSFFFALGFVSMFDVLELRIFSRMFEMANADPHRRWTRSLKGLRFTVWALVLASATANIVHAPNLWAAPFMGLMPVAAAWVIYVPLHSALGAAELLEEQRPEGRKPGPFLLISLVWRKLWAWVFGLFGLDVNDRADEMVRRARAREAADASYALRNALQERERLEKVIKEGGPRGDINAVKKQLAALERDLKKKVRPKAQNALEMADTYDPEQGLQLMQRMAWLTNADEVALLDYGPESTAMEKLEQLNIAANADFIKSSKRARDAEARAQQADKDREKAEAAVRAAEEKLAGLSEQLERSRETAAKSAEDLAAQVEAEQRKLEALREERELLESSGASAGQLYQKTLQELREIRGQLSTAQDEAKDAREQMLRLQVEHRNLGDRLKELLAERDRLAQAVTDAQNRAQQEHDEALRLKERLKALEALQKAGVPAVAPKQPQVYARIGGSGTRGGGPAGETRQRLRELLASMDPQERERAAATSRRELARVLIAKFDLELGEDAVRGHLKRIEEEDAQQQGEAQEVPAPRSEDDQPEPEHETATA